MTTVQQHYDHHLGPIYNWMIGDFEAALQRQREFFRRIGLEPGNGGLAVDLGAGSGLQAVPLAELGYDVLAFDSCRTLLQELSVRAAGAGLQRVRTVCDDLTHFLRHRFAASLIVCMGDTLTHLPSKHAVASLLRDVAAGLVPNGMFVATFRDYASCELTGPQRFVPVRGDERRILTCFLEYFPDHVQVHDLVHQLDGGHWRCSVSSYRKLRLPKEWVLKEMHDAGLSCTVDRAENGLIQLAARKADS
jgi:SAM-dependent methyltransferase